MDETLTPAAARTILIDLFEREAKWSRVEAINEVMRSHVQRGGAAPKHSSATSAVKRALSSMKSDGLILNIGKGLWGKAQGAGRSIGSRGTLTSDQVGIPLQPVYARKLILNLLAEREAWQRSDLSRRLQADHLAAGNELGTQDPLTVTKKALSYLQDAGYVQSDGRGNWSLRIAPDSGQTQIALESTDNGPQNEARPAEGAGTDRTVLGEGSESVYLYYYETEKELAALKGKTTWQCKIGRTSGDVTQRVMSQAKTSRSSPPVIAVVILSDYAAYLEEVIHGTLKMIDRHIDNERGDVGIEWFDTNPEQLIDWWHGYSELLTRFAR